MKLYWRLKVNGKWNWRPVLVSDVAEVTEWIESVKDVKS
jgi:hypothetical protein